MSNFRFYPISLDLFQCGHRRISNLQHDRCQVLIHELSRGHIHCCLDILIHALSIGPYFTNGRGFGFRLVQKRAHLGLCLDLESLRIDLCDLERSLRVCDVSGSLILRDLDVILSRSLVLNRSVQRGGILKVAHHQLRDIDVALRLFCSHSHIPLHLSLDIAANLVEILSAVSAAGITNTVGGHQLQILEQLPLFAKRVKHLKHLCFGNGVLDIGLDIHGDAVGRHAVEHQ
mmetsp:Transcript_70017/g.111357  ORF Transcript_70017/g.111357 Transcript_70017/m.111357 type:complete len:231 (+) Transcript_70017:145-837(+)